MVLTRADVVVFVGSSQRSVKHVTILDVRDSTRLLKWLNRALAAVHFGRPKAPLCWNVMADSACRADDVDCLVLRAAVIGLSELREGVPTENSHDWEHF